MIGLMVSSFPGVMHGPLFYRQLELHKTMTLKANNDDFDAAMTLSDTSKSDLNWWITHMPLSIRYPTVAAVSLSTFNFLS